MRDFIVAVGQWPVDDDRERCLDLAEKSLRAAAAKGAALCVLPEMFQTPYELPMMHSRAEPLDGPTLGRIRSLAKELSLHVVAGSFCEAHENDYFNTAVIIGPDGGDLGVHRKIHLFDVSLATVNVQESSVFQAGANRHPKFVGYAKLHSPFFDHSLAVDYPDHRLVEATVKGLLGNQQHVSFFT